MNPRVSILLICERAEQLTGSGCCGKLEGDNALLPNELFHETRQHQVAFGVLHRSVRQFFGQEVEQGVITMDSVDPRNQLYLVPRLWRDVWKYRPGWKAGLATALQLFTLPAVIVNGRVLSRQGRIDPDALCHVIAEFLRPPGTDTQRKSD
ncbi:MAG: hypothetical protein ACK4RK_15150 [Gemmataceae bacterium]